MSNTASDFVDTIPWDDLEDAYGPATNLPKLLEKVAAARGKKLYRELDQLCARVCHQGTIYSASAPAVHVVIEMLPRAAAGEQALLYGFLSEMADSAQLAIEHGPAPPSCAGGDPTDGAAIRNELLSAVPLLIVGLANSSAQIRAQAVTILTSVGDATAANLVRTRYLAEGDPQVRRAMLEGLSRLRASFLDWPGFLDAALMRETTPENRFLVRCAQVHELKSAADSACVDELVSSFVQDIGSHEDQFYEALHLLGEKREFPALLQAFELADDEDMLRALAERLLRLGFDDQRSGWGQISHSRLRDDGTKPQPSSLAKMALRAVGLLILFKLFPFVVRRYRQSAKRRKANGAQKIHYWGVQGRAPEVPQKLNETQRTILTALAAKPELWKFRTNLWELFGLPDSAAGVLQFVGDR